MLKHFGQGDDGWGDAHMLGVFGATGSGKSVMVATIIAGFAARKEMGMLIVDPQSQFSGFELGKQPDKWSWRLDTILGHAGRSNDVRVVKIDDISLETPTLYASLLDKFDFFEALGVVGANNKQRTIEEVVNYLKEWLAQESDRSLGSYMWTNELLSDLYNLGASTYTKPSERRKQMEEAHESTPFKLEKVKRVWNKVREMFQREHKLGDILDDVLINHQIIILDVNADESLKDLYCAEIMAGIKRTAEMIYRIKQNQPWKGDQAKKYKQANTNALIVIDEAHRFAPQSADSGSDKERMLLTLTDAIKTTRKLGVGWLYATQSIANFNKDIFRQILTKVLGVGIGTGADDDHLESAFNKDKDLIERYRSLPLPNTTGVYPYAIIGELVALGNGSRALFVSATKTQSELIKLNPKHFSAIQSTSTKSTSYTKTTGAPVIPSDNPEESDDIPF
jgi:hypothetical protein